MDSKVKEFIGRFEAAEQERKCKEKEEVLIACGLYVEEKEYQETRGWGDAKYDEKLKKYYKIKKIPVEVSDEEYETILEIYHKKYAKTVHEEENNRKPLRLETVNSKAERILLLFVRLDLILTILICIAFPIIGYIDASNFGDKKFTFIGIGIAVVLLIFGAFFWASQMVVINISNNLHNISKKLNSDQ